VLAIGSPRLKETFLDLTRRVADQMPVSGPPYNDQSSPPIAEELLDSRGQSSVAETKNFERGIPDPVRVSKADHVCGAPYRMVAPVL